MSLRWHTWFFLLSIFFLLSSSTNVPSPLKSTTTHFSYTSKSIPMFQGFPLIKTSSQLKIFTSSLLYHPRHLLCRTDLSARGRNTLPQTNIPHERECHIPFHCTHELPCHFSFLFFPPFFTDPPKRGIIAVRVRFFDFWVTNRPIGMFVR